MLFDTAQAGEYRLRCLFWCLALAHPPESEIAEKVGGKAGCPLVFCEFHVL